MTCLGELGSARRKEAAEKLLMRPVCRRLKADSEKKINAFNASLKASTTRKPRSGLLFPQPVKAVAAQRLTETRRVFSTLREMRKPMKTRGLTVAISDLESILCDKVFGFNTPNFFLKVPS